VDEVRRGLAEISGDDAKHLTKVLRVEVGQQYEISDNHDVYLAEIEQAHKGGVVFRALEKLDPDPPTVNVTLYAALVKFDALEWMIQKVTELGVTWIVPVIAMRSEKGLEKAAGKRHPRWERIALEASQQSRRTGLPEIAAPLGFANAIARPVQYRYVLDEEPGGTPLLSALPAARTPEDDVAILIGPEGGWTDREREAFLAAGWRQVTMGPLILRAETAATAALAVISNAWLAR